MVSTINKLHLYKHLHNITAHTTIHKIFHIQYHIHHVQQEHLQIPMLHHLPQLHNKPITDKATEYHIITLTLILILIEEK